MTATNRFFVLTGGPGAGKTTLLEALSSQGFHTMPEAGRMVMQTRMDAGCEPRGRDPADFARLMLEIDLQNHACAATLEGPVLFDRGIPDLMGYLRLMGEPVPAQISKAARQHRYNRRVLLAPHWPQIFTNDAQRDQTPAEALETCRSIAAAYRELGYETVPLPLADIESRARFARHVIADAAESGLRRHQA